MIPIEYSVLHFPQLIVDLIFVHNFILKIQLFRPLVNVTVFHDINVLLHEVSELYITH